MEQTEGQMDVVHPEVRAHINSLVSALGGISAEDDGRYQLGDDALEVLRDLKRWIRFYDEKTNRMDVARCIYEANLIEGDLLPILATWHESETNSKFKSRIALACVEIMVPLTWPMERDKERMTVNHHRHMPVLELGQVAYKRGIINYDAARILHSAIRLALPSMAMPIGDRTARDQGIIKLVLFFLRNMASIAPPSHAKYDGDETQISRSATIDAFSYQDIFHVLLMIASNTGEDFRTEDTTVMEIIYHLVKRVDANDLFMHEKEVQKTNASELSSLMKKETAMQSSYNRPARHSRFGGMIWVKRGDGKMSTISGQDALVDAATRTRKMDNSKTFKPPRRTRKGDNVDREIGLPQKLNSRANKQLRTFVEEFLDAGFNPLFTHVRKTIDREAPHVMQYHRRQFFYLVAWFLEAEHARRKARAASAKKGSEEVNSFNLVAGVLNQEMFITLNKGLHESYDMKDWHELTAIMRCFTQILLTVQDMSGCGNEDDEEIAENVLSRLFYEESTHDAIANIIRGYKDQGFEYLDAATELVHHFLRILEVYAKQNADMQVRTRKRTRRKKKAATQANGDTGKSDEEGEDSGNDQRSAERVTKERKFDFHRFANRFSPQGVVDTFIAFTQFYRDMTDTQLKRAHRYFYRLAFKLEMGVMLYRVDIISLFYNMIQGPEPLDKSSSMYKEWEELIKQILRRCFKKLEERPELLAEMLFSKLQGTAYFLEHGYEKQTLSKSQPKPGVELEFRNTEERDQQVAVAVGALLDKNQSDHVGWLKGVLLNAESERRSWAAAEEAMDPMLDPFDEEEPQVREPKEPPIIYVKPDDDDRRTAMFKNSHLRLLMTIAGLQRYGPVSEETRDSSWIVPAEITASHLKDTLHYINQAEFSPPTFDEGVSAENQLKRKTVSRRKAAYDDDSDANIGIDDDELFPVGGPTARKVIDAASKPKKIRKRRKRKDSEEAGEVDDEEVQDKARKRRDRDREKARKIKSALYVNEGDSDFDEDEDEAFFARERALKDKAEKAANSAAADPVLTLKRKVAVELDEDEEDELDLAKQVMSSQDIGVSDTEGGDARKRRRLSEEEEVEDDDVEMSSTAPAEEDAEAEAPVLARRPRVRGGFVIDSDDDDE